MRQQGRLTEWNDDRGFGFITPLDGGATVFAHVSQFPRTQRRPMATDLLTYTVATDDRGRPRAQDVAFLAPTRARAGGYGSTARPPGPVMHVAAVAMGYFIVLALVGVFFQLALIILAIDVVMSTATVLAYRSDKLAAQQGRWRTEESALHLLELLGGWPGALVAQRLYRHKTRKLSFQVVFWLATLGNLATTAWMIAMSRT